MSRHSERSAEYQRLRVEFLAVHTVCWICHHGGADSIDHDPPRARYRVFDMSTWRPAHGVKGCRLCPPNPSRDKRRRGQPRRCNQSKGDRAVPFTPAMQW